MNRRLSISILILLTIFTFANTLKNNFVWDDVFFIVNNNYIKNLDFFPQYFHSAKTYATILDYHIFRPLRTVSFALEYKLWGLNPFGFHLTNIILHLLNVLIVYFLISRLTSNRNLSFISALIFSLHPVQSEAVAWVKGRADLLFSSFFLLGFLAFLKKEEEQKRNSLPILIYLCFFLALLSKIMAITFPLILIVYKLSLGRPKFSKDDKFFFTSLFLISIAFLLARHLVIGRSTQAGYPGGGAYYTFLTMLRVFPDYLRIIIYPLNLTADYSGIRISHSITEGKVLLSLLFYPAIIFAFIFSWRKNRLLFFCLSFFFITLLPVSNIVPTMQFMAERFLYLPVLGTFVIFAFFINKCAAFLSSRQKILWLLVILFMVNFIPITIDRNSVWRNELTLWEKTFNTAPASSRIAENLAFAYLNAGLTDKAIPLFEKILPQTKKKYKILDHLGLAHLYQGKSEKAKYYFEEAISRNKNFAPAYGHLGVLFGKEKDYKQSRKCLEKAIELDPDSPEATYYYNNLGLTLKNKGLKEKAKKMFETALFKNPNNMEALKNFGAILWKEKKWVEVVPIYQKLCRLSPKNREYKYWLERAKENLRQLDK